MSSADWVALALVCVKVVMVVAGLVYVISGLDDFFVDVCWIVTVWRRRCAAAAETLPTVEELLRRPEQPIAMMIPAWDESDVIRPMLTGTLTALNYGSLHVFVGTYPNDERTQSEVDRVTERFPNVHRVVCANPGPTNKADCLNWIYRGIRRYEREHDTTFEVFVMNDSEDVVHPLYLKLLNGLLPRLDLVQLPVLPLPTPWHWFTAGHYLDEFAEAHSKDVLVREALTGVVPSAGVGTAFSRQAMQLLASVHRNQLFSTDSLTEDYDVSFRLRDHGLTQRFIWYPIERTGVQRTWWGGARRVVTREYVGIKEHFPSTLRTAYRQKARWIVGIALQGWAQIGWRGNLATRYVLFRDRKAVVTTQITPFGYLVVVAVVAVWITNWLVPESYRYPPLVEIGSPEWYLVLANAGFLSVRLFQRGFAVQRLHGWRQALLSAPRQVWGNVVNWVAGARALRLYARYLVTGRLIAWDKTAHVYPSDDQLGSRRLGDILVGRGVLGQEQLAVALADQRTGVHRRLGELLMESRAVSEVDLLAALAVQFELAVCDFEPASLPRELVALVRREVATEHEVVPLEIREHALVLATPEPPPPVRRQAVQTAVGRPVEFRLARRARVSSALNILYAHHPTA